MMVPIQRYIETTRIKEPRSLRRGKAWSVYAIVCDDRAETDNVTKVMPGVMRSAAKPNESENLQV